MPTADAEHMRTRDVPAKMKPSESRASVRRSARCLPLCLLLLAACATERPQNIGLTEGRLSPCPSSPNCASSLAQDSSHRVEPFRYTGNRDAARARLLAAIGTLSGERIVRDDADYLHVEVTTQIMRFVDDLEFHFVGDGLIHVRSASRVGHSDLGVNRKRVEALRQAFGGE
ncbi:DUF1499 domain-containing protein [Rhodocyclaceae bacterium SMB388]